ncbi:MAG: hypothetical protein JW754_04775 [Candidatus Aenigmarchaeota archaeon]|nr:hypothetical protein [Candidatus Aenigmarchaeota archaeon]
MRTVNSLHPGDGQLGILTNILGKVSYNGMNFINFYQPDPIFVGFMMSMYANRYGLLKHYPQGELAVDVSSRVKSDLYVAVHTEFGEKVLKDRFNPVLPLWDYNYVVEKVGSVSRMFPFPGVIVCSENDDIAGIFNDFVDDLVAPNQQDEIRIELDMFL